jgi:hypothetical protein
VRPPPELRHHHRLSLQGERQIGAQSAGGVTGLEHYAGQGVVQVRFSHREAGQVSASGFREELGELVFVGSSDDNEEVAGLQPFSDQSGETDCKRESAVNSLCGLEARAEITAGDDVEAVEVIGVGNLGEGHDGQDTDCAGRCQELGKVRPGLGATRSRGRPSVVDGCEASTCGSQPQAKIGSNPPCSWIFIAQRSPRAEGGVSDPGAGGKIRRLVWGGLRRPGMDRTGLSISVVLPE